MPRRPKRRRRYRDLYPDLATYLAETGDTQVRVAAKVGTSQANFSRIVAGIVIPRPPLALKLAQVCRIPLDSFLRSYVAPRPRPR